ncbi:MAG: NYN domain-containing protein [Pirellulaceae bacterium]
MAILIDGYNLMYGSGILPLGKVPHTLQYYRQSLMRFLDEHLSADDLAQTTVVFDAAESPPGLPRHYAHGTVQVYYAADHAEADDLIEELIEADRLPQKLLVVSSDHRLQRAAQRRGAECIDSDAWYDQLRENKQRFDNDSTKKSVAPPASDKQRELSEEEVRRWLEEFGE